VAVSFIGGGYWKKTTDLSQITDKHYDIIIMLYRVYLTMNRVRTPTLVGGDRHWLHRWFKIQLYFSYIMAVSFIGGGNQRPVTCSASGAFTEPMQRPHYWPEDHCRVLFLWLFLPTQHILTILYWTQTLYQY
jgi:hypothetical protein